MAHKGPHISISQDFVVNRILRINLEAFENWPESVRELAISIAEELFLVAYNPFIQPESVRASVNERFTRESQALAQQYVTTISEGITIFWSAYEAERRFRQELVERLKTIMPEDCVLTRPSALVECATDATDLRMELPLLVVEPATTEQVSALVRLANEMKFAIIPRGGGSGHDGRRSPHAQAQRYCKHDAPHRHERGQGTSDADLSGRRHHAGRHRSLRQRKACSSPLTLHPRRLPP